MTANGPAGEHVTHDGVRWSNAQQDVVEVVAYDPAWPAQYEAEAQRLRAGLPHAPGFTLEHIGSTAVSGLAAKPVIDILLLQGDRDAWPALAEPLRALGFVHWAGNPRRDRMFFVKGMPPLGPRRSHHLHVRAPHDGVAELRFRDHLRRHAGDAQRYTALKLALAAAHATDRDAYADGKTAFVQRVLAAAEGGL
jgi:GrpB-like predicted nucleotidyltransferase (UPF0157 family)